MKKGKKTLPGLRSCLTFQRVLNWKRCLSGSDKDKIPWFIIPWLIILPRLGFFSPFIIIRHWFYFLQFLSFSSIFFFPGNFQWIYPLLLCTFFSWIFVPVFIDNCFGYTLWSDNDLLELFVILLNVYLYVQDVTMHQHALNLGQTQTTVANSDPVHVIVYQQEQARNVSFNTLCWYQDGGPVWFFNREYV